MLCQYRIHRILLYHKQMIQPKHVFLLWHLHVMPDGEEDFKLIGIYACVEDAEAAKQRLLRQPGFRELPEGFQVSKYEVGKDHWTEGYVTVTHQSLLRKFGENTEA